MDLVLSRVTQQLSSVVTLKTNQEESSILDQKLKIQISQKPKKQKEKKINKSVTFFFILLLYISKMSNSRRYRLLCGLTSSSCGGLLPRLFLPFRQKRAFTAVCAYVRPFLVFNSNLQKNPKIPKMSKIFKKSENLNTKKIFVKKLKILKMNFFSAKKILLVSQSQNYAIRPELSSPDKS